MSIPYPSTPWVDGQTFSYTANDGSRVTGVYNSSKNAWTFSRSMADQGGGISPGGVVTTVDVKTVAQRPDENQTSPFSLDPTTIGTQRDINWWLYDRYIELEEQVDNITVTKDRGVWRYSNGPIVDGVFNQFDVNDEHQQTFTEVVKVVIATRDSSNTDHSFASVQIGDLIEIKADIGDDFGLLKITNIVNTDDQIELEVIHDRSSGYIEYGSMARIKIFTPIDDPNRPPIIGNIEPLEHPDFPGEPLKQGDFWYNTSRLELFIYWMNAWFPTSAPSVGFDGVSNETFTFTINRIQSIIDEVYLKNIDQDDRLDVLEENIVELEEEIDAIAPSVERGEWNYDPSAASSGNYTLLKGGGDSTDIFSEARVILVSTTDADGNPHGFNNHEAGELIQIFNKDDDEYGLYEITDIDDNSSDSQNPHFSFTVDFVRAFSSVGKAVNRGRFKFFNAPEGGTADGFVLKTGDEMSGDLTFKKDPFTGNSPYLVFKARDQLSNDRTGTVYLHGDENRLKTNTSLSVNGDVEVSNDVKSQYYRSHSTTQAGDAFMRLTSGGGYLNFDGNHERIAWKAAGGHLKGSSNKTFEWDDTGIKYLRANNGTGSTGQVLTKTSSGLQWATPSSGGGMYWGRKYVYDSSTSGTPSSGRFKVHSGNLYISETDVDGNQLRHTAGDFTWQIPFYVFSTSSNHILMASLLGTGSDYTGSGYLRIKTSGWNSNSLTNTQVYYTHLTGLW